MELRNPKPVSEPRNPCVTVWFGLIVARISDQMIKTGAWGSAISMVTL